jgi:cellulose synthase/poly-beta-1,6-N-acetylglucosamine synthase-like glycosyltransferase
LLLQRGYRVEYSAAADALTYAPESFNVFYNQRRRWMPSTFINILDLLLSARQTVKANVNISYLFIIYQVCCCSYYTGCSYYSEFLMYVSRNATSIDMDGFLFGTDEVETILIFFHSSGLPV